MNEIKKLNLHRIETGNHIILPKVIIMKISSQVNTAKKIHYNKCLPRCDHLFSSFFHLYFLTLLFTYSFIYTSCYYLRIQYIYIYICSLHSFIYTSWYFIFSFPTHFAGFPYVCIFYVYLCTSYLASLSQLFVFHRKYFFRWKKIRKYFHVFHFIDNSFYCHFFLFPFHQRNLWDFLSYCFCLTIWTTYCQTILSSDHIHNNKNK